MPLVISWICAVLLWIVKDAHSLPQILTLRTSRDTEFEGPDLEEQNFGGRQDFSEHDEASTVSHRSKSPSQSTPQIETAPAEQLGFKQLGLEQLRHSPHRLEAHSAVGNTIQNSRQTYWLMQAGVIQFRTTNRVEVADWIRIHGSRNLKVMTTSETGV